MLWLLILVPAVARHQQEVARPSGAALAGRVLTRPRRGGHPTEEGYSVDEDDTRAVGSRAAQVWMPTVRAGAHRVEPSVTVPAQRWKDDESPASDDVEDVEDPDLSDESDLSDVDQDVEPDGDPDDGDDRGWERPPPRYRPGRGGFDPEADAEAARRRYAFRQRTVLALLICAVLTGVAAVAALRVLWWAHGAVDLVLVGYLVYLRRQVREEAAIRERRAARMAGTRRTSAADDHELDEWARRGREAARRPSGAEEPSRPQEAASTPAAEDVDDLADELDDDLAGELDEDGDTERVRGVGEPIGLLPARRRGVDDGNAEPESALPPLRPTPPPPLPPGTSLVVVDDDELDLHDLGAPVRTPHRRAVGE